METKVINLSSGGVLKAFIREDIYPNGSFYSLRPCIIVLPGGGYEYLSKRESEPIILEFLSRGYNIFLLEYTVGKENILLHEPEKEVAEAVAYVRRNSKSFNVIENNIAIMGFSAGGHVALSLACHWEKYGEESRPDAVILSYPVVTMGEWSHPGSKDNLTRGDKDRIQYYSLENQCTPSIPPIFFWHTAQDMSVPPMNTILLLQALERVGASYEYHIFTKGKHGLSTCRREVKSEEERAKEWMNLASSWLSELFDFKQ